MNANTCNPRTRRARNQFYAPSFGNILKEMLHNSPSEIVHKKNVTYNKPPVNVSQNDSAYILEVALPGIRKKDVNISLDDKLLTISADIEKKEGISYRLREFDYSVFNRKFHLPKDVDTEKIDANFSKGILTLTITKKEQIKKTITVK